MWDSAVLCWYHVCQKLTVLYSSDTLVVSCKSKLCNDEGGHRMYTRVLYVSAVEHMLQLTQLHTVCHLSLS
jgi:hypothetical protein